MFSDIKSFFFVTLTADYFETFKCWCQQNSLWNSLVFSRAAPNTWRKLWGRVNNVGAPIRSDSHMTFITVRRVSISFIILRWMNSCVVCRTGAETIFLSERRALLPFCLWVLGELQTDDLGKCQRCHFYHFFNLSCWTLSRDSFTALLGKQIKRWCVFGILRVSWLKWECILDAGTSWT